MNGSERKCFIYIYIYMCVCVCDEFKLLKENASLFIMVVLLLFFLSESD